MEETKTPAEAAQRLWIMAEEFAPFLPPKKLVAHWLLTCDISSVSFFAKAASVSCLPIEIRGAVFENLDECWLMPMFHDEVDGEPGE